MSRPSGYPTHPPGSSGNASPSYLPYSQPHSPTYSHPAAASAPPPPSGPLLSSRRAAANLLANVRRSGADAPPSSREIHHLTHERAQQLHQQRQHQHYHDHNQQQLIAAPASVGGAPNASSFYPQYYPQNYLHSSLSNSQRGTTPPTSSGSISTSEPMLPEEMRARARAQERERILAVRGNAPPPRPGSAASHGPATTTTTSPTGSEATAPSAVTSTTPTSATSTAAQVTRSGSVASTGSNNTDATSTSMPRYSSSHMESSVTRLLVATKMLLESLTRWSHGQRTEEQVSDVYVRLGNDFNTANVAFGSYGIDMSDLASVPDDLRACLEECLSEDASQQALEVHLPRIREIIIRLLQGLKSKQADYKQLLLAQRGGKRRSSARSGQAVPSSAAGMGGDAELRRHSRSGSNASVSGGGGGSGSGSLNRRSAVGGPRPLSRNLSQQSATMAESPSESNIEEPVRRGSVRQPVQHLQLHSQPREAPSDAIVADDEASGTGEVAAPPNAVAPREVKRISLVDSPVRARGQGEDEGLASVTEEPRSPARTTSGGGAPATAAMAATPSTASSTVSEGTARARTPNSAGSTRSRRGGGGANSGSISNNHGYGTPDSAADADPSMRALRSRDALERRASKRFSAYTFNKMGVGGGGVGGVGVGGAGGGPGVQSFGMSALTGLPGGAGAGLGAGASPSGAGGSRLLGEAGGAKSSRRTINRGLTAPSAGGGGGDASGSDDNRSGIAGSRSGDASPDDGGGRSPRAGGSGGATDYVSMRHGSTSAKHARLGATAASPGTVNQALSSNESLPYVDATQTTPTRRGARGASPAAGAAAPEAEGDGEEDDAARIGVPPLPTEAERQRLDAVQNRAAILIGKEDAEERVRGEAATTQAVRTGVAAAASTTSTTGASMGTMATSSSSLASGLATPTPPSKPRPRQMSIFLQLGRQTRKAVVEVNNDDAVAAGRSGGPLTVAKLRMLFMDRFAYSPGKDDFPAIHIKDPASGVSYELEDLDEVGEGTLLSLNIEPLDQVKQHLDLSLGAITRELRELKAAVSQQRERDGARRVSVNYGAEAQARQPMPVSRITDSQFTAAGARVAQLKRANTLRLASASGGAAQGDAEAGTAAAGGGGDVASTAKALDVTSPTMSAASTSSSSGGAGAGAAAGARIAGELKSQYDEVQSLRRELAIMRQMHADFGSDVGSLLSSLRRQSARVRSIASAEAPAERSFIVAGKAKLDASSQEVLTLVEDLQDTVDDLKLDVIQRGVKPRPQVLKKISEDLERSRSGLEELEKYVETVKPGWKKTWEAELQSIVDEQEFLNHQEGLLADLRDDHEAVREVFANIQQVVKLRGSARPPGVTKGGYLPPPPEQGHEGLSTVMLEVRSQPIDHEKRLRALQAAERQRQRDMASRSDEFADELAGFVDGRGGTGLRKTGGHLEAERVRSRRDKLTLQAMFSGGADSVGGAPSTNALVSPSSSATAVPAKLVLGKTSTSSFSSSSSSSATTTTAGAAAAAGSNGGPESKRDDNVI